MDNIKTIYLFRHSKLEKNININNRNMHLSNEGIKIIQEFADKTILQFNYVFSSPLLRAFETALAFNKQVMVDDKLSERKIGNLETFTNVLWSNQYVDENIKNIDGESFKETRERMTLAIDNILDKLEDGMSAIIVSHAASICAYLQGFCDIKVINSKEKIREIVFNDEVILKGKIQTPSYFKIVYDNKKIIKISYHHII